jgi:hypothetical protein
MFDAAKSRLADLQKSLQVAPGPIATSKAMAKTELPKFASAAVMGSQEATNAILRSRYSGAQKTAAADVTPKATTKTAEVMPQLAAKLDQLIRQGAGRAAAAGNDFAAGGAAILGFGF